MLTQRMLAHVPLLLHPNPQRAAILGLGSGVTLGSALTHRSTAATVLEISPEVVEASRFFEAENHRALADPRTRAGGRRRPHAPDARHEAYDVIVSEPSNPWMAGIASLFTREFFEGARARLAPGGVLCQWAHTYDISNARPAIDRRHVPVGVSRTARCGWSAMRTCCWWVRPSRSTRRIGGIAAAMRRPGVAEDLASVGVTGPVRGDLAVRLAGRRAEGVGRRGAAADRRSVARWSSPGRAASSARTRDDNATAAARSWPRRARSRRRSPARTAAAHRGRLARSRR